MLVENMKKFVSLVLFFALFSINGVKGGAIPSSESEGIRRTDENLSFDDDFFLTRGVNLKSDHPRYLRHSPKRDELLEKLRIELQGWHAKRRMQEYLGPHGNPVVSGKSLIGTLTSIVDLINKVLPFFGLNPGQQMMGGGGQMMMMQGGGQMMQGGGQMMQGGGQMMQGGGQMMGGNVILVPLHSNTHISPYYYHYPYYWG